MPQTFWDMFGGCCGLRKRRPSNADDAEHQPFLSSPHHGTASIHSSIIPSPYIPAKDAGTDGGYGGTSDQQTARERISEERRVKVEEIGRDVGGRMMPLHSPFPRISTSPKHRQRSIDHSHSHTHSNLSNSNVNADASGSTASSTRSSSPSSTTRRQPSQSATMPNTSRSAQASGLGLSEGTHAGGAGTEKKESDLRKEVFSDEDLANGVAGGAGEDRPGAGVNESEEKVEKGQSLPSVGNNTIASATSSPLSTAPPSLASPKQQTLRLPSALDRPGGISDGADSKHDDEVRKVSLGISGAFGPASAASKVKTGGEGSEAKDGSAPSGGHSRGGGRGGRGRGRGRGKGKGKK